VNLFLVRPRRFNVGNQLIELTLRRLLRRCIPEPLNVIPIPAVASEEEGSLSGLTARTVHEMNLYGHGVIVGGGNLYENGQIDVDHEAIRALRPPLMLFSLSHGRIYDDRRRLVDRTDSMPDSTVVELNRTSVRSVARDDATLRHLRSLGIDDAQVGGCPSLFSAELEPAAGRGWTVEPATLISIRHPRLMSIPLRDQARVHAEVSRLIETLEDEGYGPVQLLCHDKRDMAFASSFEDVPYVLPDDLDHYLALLRRARLVVAFRLHAFIPALAFGTPAINISYDERSAGMVSTIGLEDWDIPFLSEPDLSAAVVDRAARAADLEAMTGAAQPIWDRLERTSLEALEDFADAVRLYVAGLAPGRLDAGQAFGAAST
jgi:polysaccharide pyruvyl transferase WcaK-like protein